MRGKLDLIQTSKKEKMSRYIKHKFYERMKNDRAGRSLVSKLQKIWREQQSQSQGTVRNNGKPEVLDDHLSMKINH